MNLIQTQLAGKPNQQQGRPTFFASITRTPGNSNKTIIVEISDDPMQAGKRYPVPIDDDGHLFDMACGLQRELDGYVGTPSEIDEYLRELQRFTV